MASPVICDLKGLTPEDFFRKWVRTDGAGNYALARIDMTAEGTWTPATECQDGLTWQDILALVTNAAGDGSWAINTVDVV